MRYIKSSIVMLLVVSVLSGVVVYKKLTSHVPYVVDVYGTQSLSLNEINQHYSLALMHMAEQIQKGESGDAVQLEEAMQQVVAGIKKQGNFASVGISPIIYARDPKVYFTIDVVEAKDVARLRYFNPVLQASFADPDNLIAEWIAYEKAGFDLFYQYHVFPSFKTCPAHHCVFGFDAPSLKPYLSVFAAGVSKNKAALKQILYADSNEEKRAAAAFLLAHIKSTDELVQTLLPAMQDPSAKVRNNVMRVLGMTAGANPALHLPIRKIAEALNYPETTDRNKAMWIVFNLVQQPAYADYVLHHASRQLLNELRLQQPNNHDLAYAILQKMSGKTYSDRDYVAWEKWVKVRV